MSSIIIQHQTSGTGIETFDCCTQASDYTDGIGNADFISKSEYSAYVRKYTHSTDLAYKAVGKLLEIVKVCSVTNNDVLIAFQKKAKDFEDCLVAICAKSIHCDYIVTRNKKYFEEFGIPLLTPEEFLQQFK